MNNISEIRDCYGCGVCSVACPKHIINIRHNKDGFYEPTIVDIDRCTECGSCRDICAYLDNKLSINECNIKSYAAWSNEDDVRFKCSSGGIGFEIGKYLIGKGYKACGVKYNIDSQRAEHYIAENIRDYIPSIGSKYIQSYTIDGFKSINKKDRYLVTGTPCQIDSIRRFIKKYRNEENFVLLDFFCHGVPSIILWQKYLEMVEQITGKTISAIWRNKFEEGFDPLNSTIEGKNKNKMTSWSDSYNIFIKGLGSSYNSKRKDGDLFYKIFLSNICLGKACYAKCKYKYTHSSADIRIGDLWGEKYANNKEGVSAVLTFTYKGENIIQSLKSCTILKEPLSIVAAGQIKKNIKVPLLREIAISLLKTRGIYRVVRLAKVQDLIKIWKYRLSNPKTIYRKIINRNS